jgi:short-subunit dehydrogenase
MRRFSKPTVLVTGPTSGIGRELARLFANDGHPLVLVARRQSSLDAVANELGGGATIAADLSTPGAPAAILAALAASGVEVGILVNNAGFGLLGPFDESEAGEQLAMIQVNVTALVALTRGLLPSILNAGADGGILNVASTAAFQAGPNMAIYYATKAFVLSFSEALAVELAGRTRVSSLCPGPTPTGFQARAGFGDGIKLTGGTLPLLSAEQVAVAGYRGFQRGRTLIVPGLANKATATGVRLVPRRTAARIAGALQKRRRPR